VNGVSKPDASSRDRLIRTAVRHYWRGGLGSVGVAQLLSESEATRGSLYFHFPGGKNELAAAAMTKASAAITERLRLCLGSGGSVAQGLQAFVAGYSAMAAQSTFTLGCPLAMATLEGGELPDARKVAAQTFLEWHSLISDALLGEGRDRGAADQMSRLVISGLEGALILARAAGDDVALTTLGTHIPRLLGSEPGAGAGH